PTLTQRCRRGAVTSSEPITAVTLMAPPYRHLSPSNQLERLIFRVLDALGARNEDIVDQAHGVDPGGLICRDPD
ncbi:hypothetical protein, partial [Phaeobacter sp. 22II1-1F12B]|uniref:hypothetical protein n=1 Tax=Phaeobacter sp. 22II1-1F12B TaxID=1317111 RepID=UPI001E299112